MHYTKSNSLFLWIYRIKTLPQKKTKQNGIQNIRLTDPCSKRKDTSKRLGDAINFLSKTSRSHKMSWIPVDSVSALAQFNWKIAIRGYLHTETFVCLLVSKVLMVCSAMSTLGVLLSYRKNHDNQNSESVLGQHLRRNSSTYRDHIWFLTPIRHFNTLLLIKHS